jgi:hypothetical protein
MNNSARDARIILATIFYDRTLAINSIVATSVVVMTVIMKREKGGVKQTKK